MKQGPNRLFDEFAKLMTDAAGVAQGFRREAESVLRSQAERMMAEMDVVKRDDFDAIKELAINARTENEILQGRIAALEARVLELEGQKAPKKVSPTEKK
jgi:BMFP domain-containing protein YqiC